MHWYNCDLPSLKDYLEPDVPPKPPFDHPHIFLDMGDDSEIICPYCSTLFRYNESLDAHSARPPECQLTGPPR